MENPDKKKMARRILGCYGKQYLEMLHFVDRFPELPETPAQFQERCAYIALKCFWAEKMAEDTIRPTVQQVAEELLNPSMAG